MNLESSSVLTTPKHTVALERLGDEIAELSAHLDAASARLLDLIREFDARGGWNTGFCSCAAWLAWRVGLDLGAAREKVRVARALASLPHISGAFARGELSYSKVRALTRVATPETEARLLAVGRAGTASHVELIVRGWRRVDRHAEARDAARRHARRGLHVHTDEDGTVIVRGRLTPEDGALLMRALAAARETLYQRGLRASRESEAGLTPDQPTIAQWYSEGEPDLTPDRPTMAQEQTEGAVMQTPDRPTIAQQQADALVLLAETALHHDLDPGAPGERYQVVVHVDAPVLADPDHQGQSALEDGMRVPAETSRRLACDASRVVMRHDEEGRTVEIGARTRTIPPALRRALHHRDRTCRFPGCHVPFGQGHHLHHWAKGGPTTLSNLALLCRRHHRAVHEEGYRVERLPDGTLRFRRPNGLLIPDTPFAPAVPDDPLHALRTDHDARGLRLDARTTRPAWLGERLDLSWAIDVLHPLATRRSGAVGAPRVPSSADASTRSPAVGPSRVADAPGSSRPDSTMSSLEGNERDP